MSAQIVEALRRKLDGICNALQYDPSGRWGVETIGPIREAIAALAAAEAQPVQDGDTLKQYMRECVERDTANIRAAYAAPAAPTQAPLTEERLNALILELQQADALRDELLAALEEPDDELLAEFQRAFVQQLRRRKHKAGLESAELAGIRAMLKLAFSRERAVIAKAEAV